jgi:hypothetical protein
MMNFEEDAKINISNNNLDEVSQLCQELSNLENDIQSYEETVKELKKKAEKLSMEVIPEKMNELGLKSVELNDGSKLKIAEFVQARIIKTRHSHGYVRMAMVISSNIIFLHPLVEVKMIKHRILKTVRKKSDLI